MANDNETVGQVALSDLPLAEQLRIIRGNYSIGSGEFDALDEAADVVECHQREIEAKDRRLEAASADAEAADAEIDKLKFDNMRLKSEQRTAAECIIEQTNKVEAKDAEIEKLRALIGELADALLAACNDTCDYCKKHLNFSEATASICLYNHQCNVGQAYGRLVAKAKEAVK